MRNSRAGGCQCEHGQIVFNLRSERRRHLRPAQQRAGEQQHRHAQHSRRRTQAIQGLSQRSAHGLRLLRPALFGPREQGSARPSGTRTLMKMADRTTGRPGTIRCSAPPQWCPHPEGHDRQLTRQHGHGVPGDGGHSDISEPGPRGGTPAGLVLVGGAGRGGPASPAQRGPCARTRARRRYPPAATGIHPAGPLRCDAVHGTAAPPPGRG